MKQYFISTDNFQRLVKKLLEESTVVAPIRSGQNSFIEEIDQENLENIEISGFRTVESVKSCLFKISEKVSRYFGADEPRRGKPLTILGVRGCDTEALDVLDSVFTKGDQNDIFYASSRENALIIGADCTDCGKTCFCTMVKGRPYPVRSFDINLSMVKDGYVAEVGSGKGEKLVKKYPLLFLEATTISTDEKEKNRKMITARLEDNNKDYKLKFEISTAHKRNIENKIWRQLTKDCVECSACNFICPTCTCFLLLDQNKKEDHERYKVWDACLKSGYQKVAGGANPRGRLFERLRNRYHCKFDYSFDRLDRYTCVGCGRCIDACAGNIDMRKIFVELDRQAPLTAKLGVL
jgi:formate hydrogenlyase subunit 6/NADH:ubiquinone oxidoreductase subunit I